MTLTKIAILATLLFTTSAHAEDTAAACLSIQDMKYVMDLSQFDQWNAEGKVIKQYGPADNCDQGAFRRVADAILYMRDLPAYKNTPKQFSTLVSEEGPTRFLQKRLKKIILEDAASEKCSVEGTGGYAPKETPGVINLCGQFLNGNVSSLEISQLLLHEVRHHDGLYHIHCDDGPAAMFDLSCDKSYQEQGAYGIGAGYLLYIYKGTKNEALKETARAKVIYQLTTHFNKAPLDITKGALMHRTDNAISFYDGKETLIRNFVDDVTAVAIYKGVPYIFFSNGKITSYAYKKDWHHLDGPIKDNYNKLSKDEINNLLDITLDGDYCFLLPKEMKCAIYDEMKHFTFSKFNPVKFYDKMGYVGNWVGFVNEDGRAYHFPVQFDFKDTSENVISRTGRGAYSTTSYVRFSSGAFVAVSPDGTLLQSSGEGDWTPMEAFKNYKYKKVIPFWWSQKLEDL